MMCKIFPALIGPDEARKKITHHIKFAKTEPNHSEKRLAVRNQKPVEAKTNDVCWHKATMMVSTNIVT